MKIFTLVSGLTISAAVGMAHAASAETVDDKARPQMEVQSVAPAKYSVYGVLKGIKANKLQIAHEPIAELQWPAMTMWFVLQGTLPAEVKVGDSIRFEMEQTRTKTWVVTRIERQP